MSCVSHVLDCTSTHPSCDRRTVIPILDQPPLVVDEQINLGSTFVVSSTWKEVLWGTVRVETNVRVVCVREMVVV